MKLTHLIKLSFLGIIVSSVLVLEGCMDSDSVGENYHTFEGEMIADYLSQDSDLTLFTQALKHIGAYTLMQSYGKYTIFVPNNAAMEKWYAENNTTLAQMDTAKVREMVFYHIIDGIATSVDAFNTADFPEGAFPAQNMIGRYLTAHVRSGSGNWCIKNGNDYADIISANNEAINGTAHVINEVLEGNNDLLPDFVANNPRYSIFGQALVATSWRDSMLEIEDPTYVMPSSTTLPGGGVINQTSTYYGSWPKQKKYLYTCFAESDSIMALREGIYSLDDLRTYAAKIYPEGADIEDETNPENSLHKYIGYHLYDMQMAKNKLVLNRGYVSSYDWFTWLDYICDKNYRVDQYYISMQPNMLLNVENANTEIADYASAHTVPILNCPYSPYDENYSNLATAEMIDGWPIIRIIDDEANQYCENGVLHGINNMLVFNQEVKSKVFHRRIRTDLRTYMSEGVNNGVFYDGDRSYNWFNSAIPDGFCKRIKFTSDNNTYMEYEGRTPHDYLLGDHWRLHGNFDFTITVGPLPRGSYEVRVGYTSGSSSGAVVQAYIDGEPCGIPMDTRVSAYNGDTGWIQDWLAIQESGSSRFAGLGESEEDPYGLENDKNLRNHGFMKAPNCFVGWNYHQLGYGDNLTARNVDTRLRRILGIYNWISDGSHQFRLVAMRPGTYDLDYIEFIPTDLLDDEDQH